MTCKRCKGDHPTNRCNWDGALSMNKLGGAGGLPLNRHRKRAAAVSKRRALEREMQRKAMAKRRARKSRTGKG
jgi:hypothetical protein